MDTREIPEIIRDYCQANNTTTEGLTRELAEVLGDWAVGRQTVRDWSNGVYKPRPNKLNWIVAHGTGRVQQFALDCLEALDKPADSVIAADVEDAA